MRFNFFPCLLLVACTCTTPQVSIAQQLEGANTIANAGAPSLADDFLDTESAKASGYRYIATWPDLIATFGTNADAGLAHLYRSGFNEGRLTYPQFDPLEYIAESPSAASACAGSADVVACGAEYYIKTGYYNAEYWSDLVALSYIASYPDLQKALGIDADAAISHGKTHRSENRRISFNIMKWMQNNPQTTTRLNGDFEAATRYYIKNGNTQWTDTQRFRIFSNNLCLAPYKELLTVGNAVVAWPCGTSAANWWQVRSDGTIRNTADTTKCVGVSAASPTEGSPLQIQNCNGSVTQQWDASNVKEISSLVSSNLCIDTLNSQLVNGQLKLGKCRSKLRSQWWHMSQ